MALKEYSDTSISTSVDRLLDVLRADPEMTFQKAATKLGVSEEVIESWVQFLEETGDIEVTYKFTTPYISLSKQRTQKMQKKDDDKEEKKNIDDLINSVDQQFENAARLLKNKKTVEAFSHVADIAKKIKNIIERLNENSVPTQEVDVFKRELDQIDLALIHAEEETRKKRNRAAQKILEDTYIKLKESHEKTKSSSKKYAEQKAAVQEKPVTVDQEPKQAIPSFSHDELIAKIKKELERGNLEEADKLYAELNRLYQEELPKRFELERENLKKSLFHISKDLTFARDSEQNSRYLKIRKQILDGFTNLAKIIADGKVSDAVYSLRFIQSLFSNLPEGYENEKKEMQTRLAEVTAQIAKLRTDTISRIASNYNEASLHLHQEFENAISTNDLDKAQITYNGLKAAFQRFPSELVPEKTDAHITLLSDFQKLSSLFKEVFVEQNEIRVNRTKEAIQVLNSQIENKRIEEAQRTYNGIQILIQEISDYYFEQKAELQNISIDSYKNLSDLSSAYYKEEFFKTSDEINSLIIEGERYLEHQSYELAEQTYVKALDLYTGLKPGFLDKKKSLRDSLFEFYRKVMFSKDMEIIQKNSKTVYDAYGEIVSLIIQAHHSIAINEIQSLPGITSKIEESIKKIPDEVWKKNPSVNREIEKIRKESKLYDLLKQYEEKKRNNTVTKELADQIKIFAIDVARDSPEDSNLIDYAKSIVQSPNQNTQNSKFNTTPKSNLINNANVEPSIAIKPTSTPLSQPNSIPKDANIPITKTESQKLQTDKESNTEEELEEKKSDEFEKTVSAALMLSALDDPLKDDLPDLKEDIEEQTKSSNKDQTTNTSTKQKQKVTNNIQRLKELLRVK